MDDLLNTCWHVKAIEGLNNPMHNSALPLDDPLKLDLSGFHPLKECCVSDTAAKEKFIEINDAYNGLSNHRREREEEEVRNAAMNPANATAIEAEGGENGVKYEVGNTYEVKLTTGIEFKGIVLAYDSDPPHVVIFHILSILLASL
ncbi:hypothetical protein Bca52824_024540 [Brassica carinata]|uniref:Uncharacterized protein n=1 Tax=Brassica carinata TaxID=52824 RepID=A0A8X8AVW6_BRACI|nr:hypothetical protein Bca52824_024540 [Brassica carinata]